MPAVISEQAKAGVNFIFSRAARTHLPMDPSHPVEVAQLSEAKLVEPRERSIVVLTIASYLFRLVTIFHVSFDRATRGYFTNSDPALDCGEIFSEKGNLCCGAMNRDLGKHFLQLGMSTPNLLEGRCLPYLRELKPSYLAQHKIDINQSVSLHATLCLCAYAPIDFRVDTGAADEDTGALELF